MLTIDQIAKLQNSFLQAIVKCTQEVIDYSVLEFLIQSLNKTQNAENIKFLLQTIYNFTKDESIPQKRKLGCSLVTAYLEVMEKCPMDIINRITGLCDDSEISVRMLIASETLVTITKFIERDFLEIFIYEKMIELVYDKKTDVKVEAVKGLMKAIDFFPPELIENRVILLIKDQMMSTNEDIKKIISFNLPKIMNRNYGSMQQAISTQILKFSRV